MAVLNETELAASFLANIPDNTSGDVSPSDVRGELTNLVESLQSYSGVMTNRTEVDGIAITGTPTKWIYFTDDNTSPNQLLEANVANERVLVKEPARYFVTLRFEGQWPATEDLRLEVYLNGVANPLTPISFAVEGKGPADPDIISVTDIAYIVNSAAIAAGPGGNSAEIELFVSSDTGPFNVDQLDIVMGVEYSPLSIRTVG